MKLSSSLTTKQLTGVAMFIAMAIVLKSFLSFETGSFRFTFYDIPMMLIGIVFGPLLGGTSGFIVDFIHMMISPFAFTFNVFTLSNIMWAVIPAVILFKKEFTISKVIFTVLLASIVAFSLNTIGIRQYSGMGAMLGTLPYRIAVLAIKLPLQVYAIHLIYHRVLIYRLQTMYS